MKAVLLDRIRTVGTWFLILGVFAALLLLGSEVVSTPPENAVVFLDRWDGLYYAPDCPPAEAYSNKALMEAFRSDRAKMGGAAVWTSITKVTDRYQRSTYGAVKDKSRPESQCREKGAFFESHSWPVYFFKKMGLWPGPKSRWNDDGTWNWTPALW